MSIHLKCPLNLLEMTRHQADFFKSNKTGYRAVDDMQIWQSADDMAFSRFISLSLSLSQAPPHGSTSL